MIRILNRSLLFTFLTGLLSIGQAHAVWEQPPFAFAPTQGPLDLASDADGNAITAITDINTGLVKAYYYSRATNTWSGPTVLGNSSGFNIDLDMDPSGTALAIWYDSSIDSYFSSFFDGVTWIPGTPNPFATPADVRSSNLDMNGPTTALAVWVDSSINQITSSFFSGGAWSTPTNFAPSDGIQSSAAYSANGTAVAVYENLGSLQASNYIGGLWQAPVTLDPSIPFTNENAKVAIDALGRAVAIWVNTAGDVQSSTFNGLIWLPAVTISTTPGNDPRSTSLSMSPSGTAVATWVDGSGIGRSNSYNGTAWVSPQSFANFVQTTDAEQNVSVNARGDALVVYQDENNILRSARLPLGGIWTLPEFVFDPSGLDGPNARTVRPSLSDNGFGFVGYVLGVESTTDFASVEIVPIAPTPPGTIVGSICKNQFLSGTDVIHVITFTPSITPTVVSYNISRNGVLIATIPATGPFVYLDHGRCKQIDVYTITSVDINGFVSTPLTVTIQ